MTSLELKNKVIGKINLINDDEILSDIYKLLESSEDDTEVFRLTGNHKAAIEEAKDQIGRGEFLSNDQANNEIGEWLKE